uniref:Groucho/TLE N-terminal Q-rich domain-containing protein n=1 Tax=Meloidogyne floridensis TaxID=298350 RepID=A0A915NKW1_9BILA
MFCFFSIVKLQKPLQYIGNIILISSNILFSVLCHFIWFKFLQADEEFDNNYKELEEEDEEKGNFVLPSVDKQNDTIVPNKTEKQHPETASNVEQNVSVKNDGQPKSYVFTGSLAWPIFQPIIEIPFFDIPTYQKVDLDVEPSAISDGTDLPLDDIKTLRFFFNYGVEHARAESSEVPSSDKQDNNKANNSASAESVSNEIEESKELFNMQLEQTLDEFLEKLKLMGFVENNEKINQKIKETDKDFEALQKQLDSTKFELKNCQQERDSFQKHGRMMYESISSLTMEIQKHVEIGKRLEAILNHVIPLLPKENQEPTESAIERAKNVNFQQSYWSSTMPSPTMPLTHAEAATITAQMLNTWNKDAMKILSNLSKNSALDTSATNALIASFFNPFNRNSSIPVPSSSLSSVPPTNSGNKTPKPSAEQTSSLTSALKKFVNEKKIVVKPNNENLVKTGKNIGNKPEPAYAFKKGLGNVVGGCGYLEPGKVKIVPGEEIMPVVFPSDASSEPDVPKGMLHIADLPHGDVCCTTIFSKDIQRVFTGGKGQVKVWDINNVTSSKSTDKNVRNLDSMATFPCLKDSYIRSCKLFSDGSTLIVGGETKTICILDVERGGEIKQTFDCEAEACYALAISQDCKTLFSCCSNGVVNVWDLTCGERIVQLIGHSDGASCVDISGDGQKLWTGGLDNTVRCWDIAGRRQFSCQEIESQVFSISCCPTDNWVAVGLEDNNVQVLNSTTMGEKYLLNDHKSCWFVSAGKDNVVNCWRTPYGYKLAKTKESSSVLSCDISKDDRFLLTGSGDKKASLYELNF